MGSILDSSVLISGKASANRQQPAAEHQRDDRADRLAISAVSVIELEHGIWRADTPERAARRRIYLQEVYAAIEVESFTKEMGECAARIDAEARKGHK